MDNQISIEELCMMLGMRMVEIYKLQALVRQLQNELAEHKAAAEIENA